MANTPVTTGEFFTLVDDLSVPDEEIAKYFIEDEAVAEGFAPGYRLNPALVVPDEGLESALLLNIANSVAQRRRHRHYAKKIKANPAAIRIVAEGDSWFQYPIKLLDIIDYIAMEDDMAVLCFSEAGDIMKNMVIKGEFYTPIETQEAKFFLISGGGNDLVDNNPPRRGIQDFLHPFSPERSASDYFNDAYAPFLESIRNCYDTVFQRVLALDPSPYILCHGYSDAIPVPEKGKWLGKPMSELGIVDPDLQFQIIQIVLGDINTLLKGLAEKHAPKVHYINALGVVSADGWHDEFHPDDENYKKVAKLFIDKIRELT